MNLLKETIEALKKHGKTPEDVLWVGSKDGEYAISWKEFEEIADVEYDNGYGAAEIAYDLVVVGENWWLERKDYDGKEWWEYMEPPKRQADAKPFRRVKVNTDYEVGCRSLKALNVLESFKQVLLTYFNFRGKDPSLFEISIKAFSGWMAKKQELGISFSQDIEEKLMTLKEVIESDSISLFEKYEQIKKFLTEWSKNNLSQSKAKERNTMTHEEIRVSVWKDRILSIFPQFPDADAILFDSADDIGYLEITYKITDEGVKAEAELCLRDDYVVGEYEWEASVEELIRLLYWLKKDPDGVCIDCVWPNEEPEEWDDD